MAKKFKDLKKGDSIWYFYKMDIVSGFQEKTLAEDFTLGNYVAKTTDYQIACIDKKYFGKSVYPSRYEIWATSREALQKASEKYIKKELETLQKQIEQCRKTLQVLEESKDSISGLIQ